jgi:hypothetical protein
MSSTCHVRGFPDRPGQNSMTRDDLLFALSMIWLIGLCGAALWIFLLG